eukprot:6460871-Amphidinium_carterae.1
MSWSQQKIAALAKQLYDVFQKTGGKKIRVCSQPTKTKDRRAGEVASVRTSGGTAVQLATSQSALPASRSML